MPFALIGINLSQVYTLQLDVDMFLGLATRAEACWGAWQPHTCAAILGSPDYYYHYLIL